jgi:soluble lytic murein transglycosylase
LRSTALSRTRWPPWVDYWELNNRLVEAKTDELEAFYARWPGSYVEDRLRNDWLLELGKPARLGQLQRATTRASA